MSVLEAGSLRRVVSTTVRETLADRVPERGVAMNEAELPTPAEEGRYHTYVGHVIPWYVRVAWIVFWICSAAYVLRYLLPALQRELGSPP
jgi:hypothetical protein